MQNYERHQPVFVIPLCITLITTAILAGSCHTTTQESVPQLSPLQVEPTPSPKPQPSPIPKPQVKEKEYVWYVSYGSNLCEERFFCYIEGGQYKLGGSYAQGCKDTTLPQRTKTITIPYRLYFAGKSSSWRQGGVAFIHIDEEKDPEKWTLARMWKITEEQFEEVREQEGASWYNHVINLGMDRGISMLTITNSVNQTLNQPSKDYISTIVIGLIESYKLNADEVYDYLNQKEGIQGYYSEKELRDIIEQCFNAGG